MKKIPYFKVNDLKGKFVLIEGINGSGKTTQAKLLESALAAKGIKAKWNHEPTDGLMGKIIRQIIEGGKIEVAEEELERFLEGALGDEKVLKEVSKSFVEQFKKRVALEIRKAEEKRQHLFVIDRLFDLKENILPALKNGSWVIQDRYDISCYLHGMANDVAFNFLTKKHEMILKENYLAPNLIIFYWLPINIALKRLQKSQKVIDCYEKIQTLKKVEKEARWLFSFKRKKPTAEYPLIRKFKIKDKLAKVIIINAEPSIDEVFKMTWEYIEKYLLEE